eukprot:734184_1
MDSSEPTYSHPPAAAVYVHEPSNTDGANATVQTLGNACAHALNECYSCSRCRYAKSPSTVTQEQTPNPDDQKSSNPVIHEAPAFVPKTPISVHDAPISVHDAPISHQKAPAGGKKAPISVYKAPTSVQKT